MMNGWMKGILGRLFGRDGKDREDAAPLHAALVAQARMPEFYSRLGVADTIDGRFDMLCLHGFLVLNRLKADGEEAEELGQALVDALFLDLDRGLREMGVGDVSVGKRMKKMAQAFYGRASAYETALGADDPAALEDAIVRNVFAGAAPEPGAERAMARYVRDSVEALARCPLDALRSGRTEFAALDAEGGRHAEG